MNGPEDVADEMRAHLAAAVPARLTAIRTELALDPADLPPPALVTAQERDLLNLAEWPALFVVVQRLAGLRRIDGPDADGNVLYEATYPARILGFVRGHGYDVVDLLRKRYVRAVREALFMAQEATAIDEATYTESYSSVDEDDNHRSVAGFYADVAVTVVESLAPATPTTPAPDPDGWAVEVDLDLLPHPALD